MGKKDFLKGIIGVSSLMNLGGFQISKSLANSIKIEENTNDLFATFGAIHLNNTNLEKAISFWTIIVGMKLRYSSKEIAEFGTEAETLVVVHQSAKAPFKEGYSGLYHFAIHAPNKNEFAKMLYRLLAHNYPCSPTDHTMSKSVYLTDPDGITVEFTLETPERFKRVITERGLGMEDADGTIRPGSARLNVDEVLEYLNDKDLSKSIAVGTRIGHIHLYAKDVKQLNDFYKKMGFVQFNDLPQYRYADVGAGGAYQHRIGMNEWHGTNKPLAPKENAGMRHYQIIYNSQEKRIKALNNIPSYEEKDNGFWVVDPTGNQLILKYK